MNNAIPVDAEVVPPGTGPHFPTSIRLPSGWAGQLTIFVLGVASGIALCWVIKKKL